MFKKAITKAMRTNKIDKPGKVYVVTKQTGGGGSMGNMTSSGKNKVKLINHWKEVKKMTALFYRGSLNLWIRE